ncbi:MAG: tetratricopeptide repeat protein [Bacteroidota bacterium]
MSDQAFSSNAYDQLIDRGLAQLSAGDLPSAKTAFEEALALDPERVEAYTNLGSWYQFQGDHPQAIGFYTDGLRRAPTHVLSLYGRGISFAALQQWAVAQQAYEDVLELEPSFARAWWGLGMMMAIKESVAEAAPYFHRFLELAGPQEAEGVEAVENLLQQAGLPRPGAVPPLGTLLDQAFSRWQQDDLEGAIWAYSEVLNHYPENPLAYANRGELRRRQGDLNAALMDFHQAIKLDPEAAVLYLNRGLTHAQVGQAALAREDYQQALSLNPELWEAHGYLGILDFEQGNPEAMKALSQAVQHLPDFWEAQLALAKLHLQAGEISLANEALLHVQEWVPESEELYVLLEKIAQSYQAHIKGEPQDPMSYVRRAQWYARWDRHEEALADWDKAVSLDKKNPTLIHGRGKTREALEEFSYALLDYDKAIFLDETRPDFYYDRAYVHLTLMDQQRALEDMRKAYSLDMEKPAYAIGLGQMLRMYEGYEDALMILEELMEKGHEDPVLFHELGLVYLGLGNTLLAEGAFEKLMAYEVELEVMFDYVWILIQHGEKEKARAFLTEREHEIPWQRAYRLEWGHLCLKAGDAERARQAMEWVLEQAPFETEAWAILCEALLKLEDWEELLTQASRALVRDPQQAHLYFLRGKAFWALGEWDRARSDGQQCLDLEPENPAKEEILLWLDFQ